MTTRRRIHSILPIRGVSFQYRTGGKEERRQNLGIDFHNLNKATPIFLWPTMICPKWIFIVLVLSVYLNGLL
jgi:hypothetical protein